MLGMISEQSLRKKLIAGGSALVLLIGILVVVASSSSGSSISDSASCADFAKSDPGEQNDYLASKLEDSKGAEPSSEEVGGYSEGVRLNCSKGYGESIGESVERTNSEVEEVVAEGGDLEEGIGLIRERTEERETYGEINQAQEEVAEEEGY